MIHKVYIIKWIALVLGIIFLIITLYSLFKRNKRDRIISICIFCLCVVAYTSAVLQIEFHNEKAKIFYGKHKLINYNNSSNYSIEILPNRVYKLYKNETVSNVGEWDVVVEHNKPKMLLIGGKIFGTGEYELE